MLDDLVGKAARHSVAAFAGGPPFLPQDSELNRTLKDVLDRSFQLRTALLKVGLLDES